jgi:hypothetical protein
VTVADEARELERHDRNDSRNSDKRRFELFWHNVKLCAKHDWQIQSIGALVWARSRTAIQPQDFLRETPPKPH